MAVSSDQYCKTAAQRLMDAGLTQAQAAGICSNIYAESGFDPYEIGIDGSSSGKHGVGGGLVGWYYHGAAPGLWKFVYGNTSSLDELNRRVEPYWNGVPCSSAVSRQLKAAGFTWPISFDQQMNYIVQIATTGQGKRVRTAQTASEAAQIWQKDFERPAKITDRWAKHGNKVNAALGSSFPVLKMGEDGGATSSVGGSIDGAGIATSTPIVVRYDVPREDQEDDILFQNLGFIKRQLIFEIFDSLGVSAVDDTYKLKNVIKSKKYNLFNFNETNYNRLHEIKYNNPKLPNSSISEFAVHIVNTEMPFTETTTVSGTFAMNWGEHTNMQEEFAKVYAERKLNFSSNEEFFNMLKSMIDNGGDKTLVAIFAGCSCQECGGNIHVINKPEYDGNGSAGTNGWNAGESAAGFTFWDGKKNYIANYNKSPKAKKKLPTTWAEYSQGSPKISKGSHYEYSTTGNHICDLGAADCGLFTLLYYKPTFDKLLKTSGGDFLTIVAELFLRKAGHDNRSSDRIAAAYASGEVYRKGNHTGYNVFLMCVNECVKFLEQYGSKLGIEATGGGSFNASACGAAGAFTGKTREQKLTMLGIPVKFNHSTYPESLAVTQQATWKCPVTGKSFQLHKGLHADLTAIALEIRKAMPNFHLGWCGGYCYRATIHGNLSYHSTGCAVDITNSTGNGQMYNPWFAHRIGKSDWFFNSTPGSKPNWGFTKYSTPAGKGYDPNYCIWSWDHPVVKIFVSHGWGWGGAYGDTMHFSISQYKTADGMCGGN